MAIIPVHDLMIKDLKHPDFDIISLNGVGERNYDGVVPHRHNFYELLVFTEGGGIHEVDFNDYAIKANSIHFVSPTQVHKLKASQSKGFVMCFTIDVAYPFKGKTESFVHNFPFYDFNLSLPFLQVSKKRFDDIFALVKEVNTLFYTEHPFKLEIIKSYLFIILLEIKACYLENRQSIGKQSINHDKRIKDFIELVDKHYADQLGVINYAHKLSLSPNYLNALCKKETGKTAIQLIHDRILLEARRLLYSTQLSVKEVSYELNFEDVAYFNRFFKKNMSVTPLEYRQQFSNQ